MLFIKKIFSFSLALLLLIYSSGVLIVEHQCLECEKTQLNILQKHECEHKQVTHETDNCCSEKSCTSSNIEETVLSCQSSEEKCCKFNFFYIKITDSFEYKSFKLNPDIIFSFTDINHLLSKTEILNNLHLKTLFKIPPLIKGNDLLTQICNFRL